MAGAEITCATYVSPVSTKPLVGGRTYNSNMHSIDTTDSWNSLFIRFEAAQDVLFASFDSLTVPELCAALERYDFLIGRLDALIYELRSPFLRQPGRRT
jgi:hypothetical protein